MRKIFIVVTLVATVLLFGQSAVALAHGAVTNQNKDVEAYNIEFEYDDLGPVYALEPYNYSFYLLDKTTKEKVSVDTVSAVFTKKDGTVVLGANLKGNQIVESSGKILGVMPEAGEYVASLSFLKGEKELAKTTFDYTVLSAEKGKAPIKPQSNSPYLWAVAGLAIGFGLAKGMKKTQ